MIVRSKPLLSHSEYRAEYPLSRELPYWDFLESNVGPCAVLSDGSLVQGFRVTGSSIETWDAEQINRLTQSLRAFLNSLPDQCELQFWVETHSDFSDTLSKHERIKGNDPLISWLTQARVDGFKSATDSQALRRRSLFLFIYSRVGAARGKLASFFSKPRSFEQVRREEFERRARELSQLSTSVKDQLSSIDIVSSSLSSRETQEIVYRFLNPLRSRTQPQPTLSTEHRSQEFTPEELQIQPKLALASPREQLAFSDVIQGVDAFFLDGHHHRVVTLKALPEFTHSALISRLSTLPFHHVLSVQLQVPEQSRELAALQSKRRMAHSMSLSQGGRVTDLESEAKLQSTEELLRELIQTGQKIFYFQAAVLLRSESREDLELQTKAVLSRIRELNGAEGCAETVAGFKVFKTIFPAGNTTLVRSKRIKSDNLADFLPLYQAWEGDARPVCLFQNRASGLHSYDPFDPSLPNFNSLVTGSSGSGKSFLNNCILLQYLSQKPLLYIIDIGGSYRKLCEFRGGQYIEITPPKNGEAGLSINPFLLPDGATEPAPEKTKFLVSLLETIFANDEGDKLPKLDKSLLEEAIGELYSQILPAKMPKLSDLALLLEHSPHEALRNYAKMLYPWTGRRPYGRLLDADNALDLQADLVVFDLKGLASYPDLQAVMILIITDFVLGKIDGNKDRPKRIIMDECWELLKSRGASSFMEYSARTLRKTGSGITFITQGLEEIERSPIGPAILNNTATKFILMQRGDLEATRKILKLNDQEMSLITSLKQQKGSFSEAFLIANENRAVIRVCPTPLEYWLATSDAADNALLDQAKARFPNSTLAEVIHYLAQHFPHGSQGRAKLPEATL